eukprot:2539056-Rhodomonas_salina.1
MEPRRDDRQRHEQAAAPPGTTPSACILHSSSCCCLCGTCEFSLRCSGLTLRMARATCRRTCKTAATTTTSRAPDSCAARRADACSVPQLTAALGREQARREPGRAGAAVRELLLLLGAEPRPARDRVAGPSDARAAADTRGAAGRVAAPRRAAVPPARVPRRPCPGTLRPHGGPDLRTPTHPTPHTPHPTRAALL